MKRLCVVALVVLGFASPSLAVFSAEEKVELRKLIWTASQVARAQEDVGFALPTLGKAATIPILNVLRTLHLNALDAIDCAFSSEGNSNATRSQEVACLITNVGNMEVRRLEAIALMQALPPNNDISKAIDHLVGAPLNTFDTSLGYLDPLPVSFPRVVGPHGDHEKAQSTLEHATQYMVHAYHAGIRFWELTAAPANSNASEFFRKNGRALERMYLAWGMSAEIVLPKEDAIIKADVAASSGLRPYDFFRLLLEVEYLFAPEGLNWRGRDMNNAATEFIREFADAFARMSNDAMVADPASFLLQWQGRRGSISNDGPTGYGAEFLHNLGDFWETFDKYGGAVMLFFHTIPAPPSGLVCGPGTHQEGNQCVADPCPECPPPPVCPVFVPQIVLDAPDVARAICVQQ